MKIEITNQGKWHQSMTLKLVLLAFLGMVLLIPLQMIKIVILERQSNSEKVIKEVSDQWAAKQCLSGPVLNIPVRIRPSDSNDKSTVTIWHIMPENLEIRGVIKPQIRKRGIYKAVIYDSEITINGQFIIPQSEPYKNADILWSEAYYTTGISDNRGLKGKVVLSADSANLEAEPGVRDNDLFISGISFPCPAIDQFKKMNVSIKINLSGSAGLQFTPIGKTTTVYLQSDWKSPGFNGTFLPVSRKVDDKGFSAEWQVTHLNRNFPQSWTGNIFHPTESSFGVDLYQPVDHYQKSWRSARYGILFIALTFLVLLFIEITYKENVHIFHYFLVSLGLVLFFSLLNSLSEQVGFNIAYLVASAGTIFMISVFMLTLFREKKKAIIVAGMLALLYAFIFILLSLNDFSYLAGNVGLFILLFAIMILSSRMKVFEADISKKQ